MTGPQTPAQALQEIAGLFTAGRHAEIESSARRWLTTHPDNGHFWKALGIACGALGKKDEALAAKERAVALLPRDAQAQANLGNALVAEHRHGQAEQHFRSALALDPGFLNAMRGLASVLVAIGRFPEAAEWRERICSLQPGSAAALAEWGDALHAARQAPQARAAYERALAIEPRCLPALSNLAYTLWDLGFPTEAERRYREALAFAPENAALHSNFSFLLKNQGRPAEALEFCRKALALDPDSTAAHSNLLLTLNHLSGVDAEDAKSQAMAFGRWAAARAPRMDRRPRVRAAGEPLRVGLVSGDLRSHPVGHFLESTLAQWPTDRVQLYAYPTVPLEDELTLRIRGRFTQWRPIAHLGDEQAAGLIAQDDVDVLLDLSGHTAHNRLPLFARRPAPVQASWLGYFATTGLAEMDWVIADRDSVPPEHERHFTERVWCLPHTRLCFTPPQDAPAVQPPPASSAGCVTFGSFQNCGKISDAVLALWSQVIQAVPRSRLRLQNKQLGERAAQDAFAERLARAGVDPRRVSMHGATPRIAYLQAHAEVDIILDTFPYPGGTTTCEALWMGVPTLTLSGENMLARQGHSLLNAAGLPEWVARDPADYLARAVAFAGDIGALARLRTGLREHLGATPLFDASKFAANLTEALLGMARPTA
ncbi:MAG: glycosyltransferase [Ramlibacter sp.]|nr:glycosyltransferase [Ramlibacter sp.]